MSTSGFYNYHPKVAHPTTIFPQMESGGFQTPFFFGGSQVPVNLGLATGSGFRTSHKFTNDKIKTLDMQGRGIKTTMDKHNRIMMPKHMASIR